MREAVASIVRGSPAPAPQRPQVSSSSLSCVGSNTIRPFSIVHLITVENRYFDCERKSETCGQTHVRGQETRAHHGRRLRPIPGSGCPRSIGRGDRRGFGREGQVAVPAYGKSSQQYLR